MPAISVDRMMPAARRQVAHDGSLELLGALDIQLHDRFEQDGARLLERVAKRIAGTDLERAVGAVDFVIGAVVHDGFHAHDRVTRRADP